MHVRGLALSALWGLLLAVAPPTRVHAQSPAAAPTAKPAVIHLIWMGGNDCPPCVAWRQTELPRLEKSPAFQAIRFSYVNKTIRSPVPPKFFLPDEVKPLKEQLDASSGGLAGSPQGVLVVDGVVFDYFHGTRTAPEIEQMIAAARAGTAYPFQRCLKMAAWHRCAAAS